MSHIKHIFNTLSSKLTESLIIVALVGFMSACGGGGGSEDDKPTIATQAKLTIEITGLGAVNGNNGSITCSGDCFSTLNINAEINLVAAPQAGYVFQQWNGACSGSGSCTIIMSDNKTVAAIFAAETVDPVEYDLTVTVSGNGSVQSSIAGINCGNDCSETYTDGTQLSLVATPANGYVFQQWNGACTGSAGCSVSMSANQSVQAVFIADTVVPTEYTLVVSVSGNGSVQSSGSGINCGSDCSETYNSGTQVSLTATPAAGYVFQQWNGACSGAGNCNLTMTGNLSVSALFVDETVEPVQYSLSVSVGGSGSVTSSPAGINCGSACSQNYTDGTQVVLQAAAQTGFAFQQWSGACSGSGTCSVTMTQNRSVSAEFVVEPVDPMLTVSVVGEGVVTSSPGGINCGSDCEEAYPADQQVILSATASTNWDFSHWSGACSGAGTCNVTMNDAVSVTANFIEEQRTLTVTASGEGTVTSNPSGINCGSSCSADFAFDSQVSLIASPASGQLFDHWSGACSGNGACSVTLSADKSVSAVFVEDTGQQSGLKIEEYSAPNDAFTLGQIPNNASGITWHEDLQQYLVVRNNAGQIYRFDTNFAYLGELHVSGVNQDTEGLGFVGGNEVMVVTEGNFAHKLNIEEFTSSIDGSIGNNTQAYRLLPPPPSNNAGLEGVAVRKAKNGNPARVYACQEGGSGNNMRVVYFDMPADNPSVLLSYDSNLTVVEPFNADQAFAGFARDIAGMVFDERTGHLIIVSQESRRAIQVDPDTGAIISSLDLTGAPQFEGVTIGPNGELVFVSEANWIRIYTRP